MTLTEAARLGGEARAAKCTPQERRDSARYAAHIRWQRQRIADLEEEKRQRRLKRLARLAAAQKQHQLPLAGVGG
jgi:hypothetical protein